MKILIVDDEADIRLVARVALEQIGGMKVIEASNGYEGVKLAAQEGPSAILLDVMMPLMDGPTTIVSLRENPATANIPVVFLTAQATPSAVDWLKSLGASGVITKPFDPKELAQDIRNVVDPPAENC